MKSRSEIEAVAILWAKVFRDIRNDKISYAYSALIGDDVALFPHSHKPVVSVLPPDNGALDLEAGRISENMVIDIGAALNRILSDLAAVGEGFPIDGAVSGRLKSHSTTLFTR